MANKTINDLTEITTRDRDDFLHVWDTSGAGSRKFLVGRLTRHHGNFTVAALPTTSLTTGDMAFATNGRKAGEGSGAGTGVPVWYDGSNWKTYYGNATVTA